MNIKIQDFDSKFDDTSLISSKDDDNQSTDIQVQKQQTRILNQVYFLFNMSLYVFAALSFSILNQDIKKARDDDFINLSYLASYMFISEICASVVWGFVSDKIGRKKALNISLIGSALTMTLTGFCKSFNSFAFIYALLGAFSCSGILIKTMLAESNCRESRPKAFSSLAIKRFIACALGVSFAAIYDMVLDRDTTSINGVPYIIPSLVASGISVGAYIISNRYLSETLNDKRAYLDEYDIAGISTDQIMISTKSTQVRIFGLKFSKNSIILIAVASLLNLIYKGYFVISQSWPTMELSKGGLNLKFEHISVVKLLFSIILFTILIKYPYIYKKIGALKLFKVSFSAAGILFIFSLILTLIAKIGSTFIVLSLYAILFSIKMGIALLKDITFDLLLADSAEDSGNLGTLFGISNILFGAIYLVVSYLSITFSDLSIENNLPFPLNYSCTWFLAILSLVGYWLSLKIKHTA
ncbi:MFS general substrate transporter [Conidiobolus coronatus NRRL 28638]|uniref:MFS general substrate transporter n=1 Tax=Conidiobolus coronatus (strain ATCC 28846 / CBS 209.66 / NRRL 28638) TaxID=796925 RepID=A0A137P0Y3_CONC2|nr:MFS general substrate transporter [Conidiobolus coronatus NRRL 28638]|eukprot:KXN68534.1 MFS general substrate transporter [Conidiobolus coronatus NRRL 28638]